MEGVGDRTFRKAMATIGGFDEAVRDFMRVPSNAHVKSLAKEYDADELGDIPLAAQLMGSDPELMADMAVEVASRGAPRIDLNCGCPSNRVTGRGAGSSLLKEPDFLYEVAKSMVGAVKIPVTIKMRSGYDDISLFTENLLAAQESGAHYITLHPRTKVDGYGPPARWDLIAKAKETLKIPVVGNGDILNVQNAVDMLQTTACDALMIGRGSVINPFIFHQIKAHFAGESYIPQWKDLEHFLYTFSTDIEANLPTKGKVNKLKQLMSFLFKGSDALSNLRDSILTSQHQSPSEFMTFAVPLLQNNWCHKKTLT
ncbi:MAG: tRNA-dihydrouridine synthase family protein [Verrucomicrobia bacterium]|nr:tRNA-dihydrouridine synthase family protein [Verrucomicrobiota bacterium]